MFSNSVRLISSAKFSILNRHNFIVFQRSGAVVNSLAGFRRSEGGLVTKYSVLRGRGLKNFLANVNLKKNKKTINNAGYDNHMGFGAEMPKGVGQKLNFWDIKTSVLGNRDSGIEIYFKMSKTYYTLKNITFLTLSKIPYSYFYRLCRRELGGKVSTSLLTLSIKSLYFSLGNGENTDLNLGLLNKSLINSFFFNKTFRSVIFSKKRMLSFFNQEVGYRVWGLGTVKEFPSLAPLFGFYFSLKSKIIYRSAERFTKAATAVVSRCLTANPSYKKSLTLLSQSWGNYGSVFKVKFSADKIISGVSAISKEEWFNLRDILQIGGSEKQNKTGERLVNSGFSKLTTLNAFSGYSKYKNMIDADLRKSFSRNTGVLKLFSEQSGRVSSVSFVPSRDVRFVLLPGQHLSDAGSMKVNPVLYNWLKAGYLVLSKDKVIKYVGVKRNHAFFFDSKVFGHPFHLVNPSILPITLSFVFFTVIQDLLSSFWLEMWYSSSFSVLAHAAMIGLFFSVILSWMFEIYSEEQGGFHTLEVQSGFKYAILLFILSELMLFISFFWAYFHFSLNSNSFTGGSYTPKGLVPFYSYRIPLLNTLLLLASGLSLTVAHTLIVESDKLTKVLIWIEVLTANLLSDMGHYWNSIVGGFFFAENSKIGVSDKDFAWVGTESFYKRFEQICAKYGISKKRSIGVTKFDIESFANGLDKVGRVSNDFQVNIPKSFAINFRSCEKNTVWQPNYWILDTVLKGFVFLIFQAYEYTSCMFSMNDGTYGAVFFSLTGLHGVHVFLGVLFLFFGLLVNLKKNNLSNYVSSLGGYYTGLSAYWSRGAAVKNSLNYKVWTHRIAFDGAAWYWHFVDVVWFFVFVFVYWWGFSA